MNNERKAWEEQWALFKHTQGEPPAHEEIENLPMKQVVAAGAVDPLISRLLKAAEAPFIGGNHKPDDPSFHATSLLTSRSKSQTPVFEVGDILCLGPELVPRGSRPIFVYVLEVAPGEVTVLMFSPLAVPASQDEILTGIKSPEGLSVLSIWNSKKFPLLSLMKSWREMKADVVLIKDVRSLWQAIQAGDDCPEFLSSQVGRDQPVSLNDNRWDYFGEIGGALADIDA